MCGCLSRAPYWGPGLQPRHVPWLGIDLATLWFAGRCSIHWATPATANHSILKSVCDNSNIWISCKSFLLSILSLNFWQSYLFLHAYFSLHSKHCAWKIIQIIKSTGKYYLHQRGVILVHRAGQHSGKPPVINTRLSWLKLDFNCGET